MEKMKDIVLKPYRQTNTQRFSITFVTVEINSRIFSGTLMARLPLMMTTTICAPLESILPSVIVKVTAPTTFSSSTVRQQPMIQSTGLCLTKLDNRAKRDQAALGQTVSRVALTVLPCSKLLPLSLLL